MACCILIAAIIGAFLSIIRKIFFLKSISEDKALTWSLDKIDEKCLT